MFVHCCFRNLNTNALFVFHSNVFPILICSEVYKKPYCFFFGSISTLYNCTPQNFRSVCCIDITTLVCYKRTSAIVVVDFIINSFLMGIVLMFLVFLFSHFFLFSKLSFFAKFMKSQHNPRKLAVLRNSSLINIACQ